MVPFEWARSICKPWKRRLRVVFSLLQVTYRLTYEDVEEMLFSGLAGSNEEWELGRLAELSMIRHRYIVIQLRRLHCRWFDTYAP